MTQIKKVVPALLVVLLAVSGGVIWWGYAHLTGLVQSQVRAIMGDDLSIGTVTAHWNRIELKKVVLLRRGKGPFDKRLAIDRIELTPRLKSIMSRRLELGTIKLENPYVLVEITPDGSPILPVPQPKDPAKDTGGKPLPVIIDGITVSGGTIDVLDWYAGRKHAAGLSNPKDGYHFVSFSDIVFDFGAIEIPMLDAMVPLHLALKSQGGGTLSVRGSISPKTLESQLKLDIRELSLVRYRPYFLKPGDLGITSGLVSVGSDISVAKRQLKAPGTIVLKDLVFDQSGSKGIMMGLPAWALVSFLSDNKGELKVEFSLNGSLDNPRFTIRESFVNQVASAISDKLGIATAGSVGSGIVGGAGSGVIKGLMKAFGGK